MNARASKAAVWVAVVLAMTTAIGQASARELLITAGDAAKLGYRVLWASDIKTPGSSDITHATVLADILVTVERPTNLVTAVSLREGKMLWTQIIGDPTEELYAPVRSDAWLLINSSHEFYRIEANTGKVLYINDLDYVVGSGPSLYNNLAIFGGLNGRAFGYNINAGHRTWAYQMTGETLVRPVLAGNAALTTDIKGNYVALDAQTGSFLWSGRTFGRILAEPAVSGMGIFIPSEDKSLYALDRNSGQDRWIYRTDQRLTRSPVVLGRYIYLPVPGRGLVALESRYSEEQGWQCQELWTMKTNGDPVALVQDRLLVNEGSKITAVEPATGKVLLSVPVERLQKIMMGPDNSLVLLSPTGKIMRLDPKP